MTSSIIETMHGRVIREKAQYITERRPVHFFTKYNSFGISKTELLSIKQLGVQEVLIIYTNDAGEQKPYLSKLDDWFRSKWYDNKGDIQLHLSIDQMRCLV